MTHPAVNPLVTSYLKEVYIPEGTPIYLRLNGKETNTYVYCTKPGIYTMEYYMDYSNMQGYYVKRYPTVYTHYDYEYDAWIVWESHLHHP